MSAQARETTVVRGARAEKLAAAYLEQAGYRIVGKNHRCAAGEIDIIAWDGPVLCFVEVRSRANAEFGMPLETIGRGKIRRIVCAAHDYLEQLAPPWPDMRFDAIGILLTEPPEIELVRGAFEA